MVFSVIKNLFLYLSLIVEWLQKRNSYDSRKKILLVITLSLGFSGLAVSETPTVSSSVKVEQQGGFDVKQAAKKSGASQLKESQKDNARKANQQAGSKKKSSMIDYCRKHTC